MKKIFSIWKREAKFYFTSPLAYILTAIFILLLGLIFFNVFVNFVENIQTVSPESVGVAGLRDHVFTRFLGNMNFLFLLCSPLITMRLLSEEQRQGTLYLLLNAPINNWQIVLGKYFAALTLLGFMLLSSVIFPLCLYFSGMKETSVILVGYLGVFFNILAFTGIGIFASSLSDNQLVAGLIAMIIVLLFWFISWFSHSVDNMILSQMMQYLSVLFHFDYFARGLVSLTGVVYHLSFVFFFLFLSRERLEVRYW